MSIHPSLAIRPDKLILKSKRKEDTLLTAVFKVFAGNTSDVSIIQHLVTTLLAFTVLMFWNSRGIKNPPEKVLIDGKLSGGLRMGIPSEDMW